MLVPINVCVIVVRVFVVQSVSMGSILLFSYIEDFKNIFKAFLLKAKRKRDIMGKTWQVYVLCMGIVFNWISSSAWGKRVVRRQLLQKNLRKAIENYVSVLPGTMILSQNK